MIVKICGISSLDDASEAIEAGADMLGFNFYPPSPRSISHERCLAILEALGERRAEVTTVGVFVNAPVHEVEGILDRTGLDLAQLHGDEPPEHLHALGARAFKALRPRSRAQAQSFFQRLPARAAPPAALLDAHHPDVYGGSGRTGDWDTARAIAARAPILLAGGLHPENVSRAIAGVHPWGVDVASGVERREGRKDHRKMRAFVQRARAAERVQ